MVEEQIIIRIRAIDEATKQINQVAKTIGNLKIDMPKLEFGKELSTNLKKVRVSVSGLNKDMGDVTGRMISMKEMSNFTGVSIGGLNKQFRDLNVGFIEGIGFIDKFTGKQVAFDQVLKKATIQSRRFKFEWLSVMFAGMALDRVFGSIVKKQLDLYGVTDLTSAMWTDVMGNAMDIITPKLYDFLGTLMDMPESVKTVIGFSVVGADVIAKALSSVGQLSLGYMGFKMVLSDLKPHLSTIAGKIDNLVKYAGATIFLGLALKDTAEGEITAAVGDVLAAAGFLKGGKVGGYLMAIGITLKFLGDKEFQVSIYKFFWQLINTALNVGDAISKALTGKFDEIDFGKFDFWQSASDALVELQQEGKITNDVLSDFATSNSLIEYRKELENLNEKLNEGEIDFQILTEEGKKLGDRFDFLFQTAEDGTKTLSDQTRKVNDLTTAYRELSTAQKAIKWISKVASALGIGDLKIPFFQEGGIMKEEGLAYLHAGEKVIPKGQGSEIIFSPTVYITSTINNDMDIRSLATKLNEYWFRDFERIAQIR